MESEVLPWADVANRITVVVQRVNMKLAIRLAVTVLMISLIPSISQAIAKGKLGAGYGFLFQESNSEVDFVRNVPGTTLFGGAFLLVKGGLSRWVYAEMTLQYGEVEFVRRSNGNTIRESGKRIHVPILFRLPALISPGIGFYGSYRIGSVNSPAQFQNSELTSAQDYGEHGLEFALAFQPPADWLGTRFFVDFRAHYSLTSRANENEVWNKLLIGLTRDF